jgi:CRP-like cAMP-binding protein
MTCIKARDATLVHSAGHALRWKAGMETLLEQACRPAALGRSEAQALTALARTRRVAAGELVLSRTEPASALWLVASGRVALGTRGAAGLLQHRCSIESAQWLDLASAFAGGCHAEDAVAETAAVLWELPLQAVREAGTTRPQLLAALAGALAASMVSLLDAMRSLMMQDVPGRCASWLLQHAGIALGQKLPATGFLQLRQRKRIIAAQLGTTAETLSRTLRQLTERGLIEVHGYEIRLLDVAGLARLADPLAQPSPARSQPMVLTSSACSR